MRLLKSPRIRLLLWVALIVIGVVPWLDLQNHSHWMNVQWIPFVSPPVRPTDIVLNVLLYVPFGYWFVRSSTSSAGRIPSAVAAALALSLFTEWTQLYSHSRFPSLTDVTNNVIGAALGAWFACQIT